MSKEMICVSKNKTLKICFHLLLCNEQMKDNNKTEDFGISLGRADEGRKIDLI
jgi:hypothetical protein